MNSATGRPVALFACLLVSALLGGCTTSVVVEGSLPVPLVTSLPVRAGVHFSEEFRSFRYEEEIEQGGKVEVDFGRQNTLFFEQLFGALFAETVPVDGPPVQDGSVDLLVIPHIDEYGFLSPAISGLNFYATSIHYRMELLTPAGEPIASWTVVGYGKSPKAIFGSAESVNKATRIAIRDGGARLATGIRKQADFMRWLEDQGLAGATGEGDESPD